MVAEFAVAHNPKAVNFAGKHVIATASMPFRERGANPGNPLYNVAVGWGACGHVWKGDMRLLKEIFFAARHRPCVMCVLARDV